MELLNLEKEHVHANELSEEETLNRMVSEFLARCSLSEAIVLKKTATGVTLTTTAGESGAEMVLEIYDSGCNWHMSGDPTVFRYVSSTHCVRLCVADRELEMC